MHTKILVASLSALSLLTLLFSWLCLPIKPDHYRIYRELERRTLLPEKRGEKHTALSSTQRRKGVTRELFRSNHKPVYLRMEAPYSELIMVKDQIGYKAVEKMAQARVVIKEEEMEEHQKLRFVEAKQALYDYTHKKWIGQEVKLQSYNIPLGDIPLSFVSFTPFGFGATKHIELLLWGDQFDVSTGNIEITLNPKEGL